MPIENPCCGEHLYIWGCEINLGGAAQGGMAQRKDTQDTAKAALDELYERNQNNAP